MEIPLLGTPETSLRGRSTRKALSAFTSKPSFMSIVNTVLTILQTRDMEIKRSRAKRSFPLGALFFSLLRSRSRWDRRTRGGLSRRIRSVCGATARTEIEIKSTPLGASRGKLRANEGNPLVSPTKQNLLNQKWSAREVIKGVVCRFNVIAGIGRGAFQSRARQ